MKKQKDLTVFIGRFSPFHNGHAAVLKRALEQSKVVLILVGSSGQARNTKNPFTFDERANMIHEWYEQNLDDNDFGYLSIKPIYDHPYNDAAWIRGVQDAVDQTKRDYADILDVNPTVFLTGSDRDKSTWYLHTFGDYFVADLVTKLDTGVELSATWVREILFSPHRRLIELNTRVPEPTLEFLRNFQETDSYPTLCKEYEYIEKYKAAWELAPYKPMFVTVDACVIQSGHVLLNIRENFPGKGLWALPGGFLEQEEKLIDGCVRELIEETRIALSKAQLYGSIRSKETFDHPDRSLRGRTITTCYLFKLDDSKPLPKVKPQRGEVTKVEWVPINEALNQPERFFEDHYHILQTMYGRIPG